MDPKEEKKTKWLSSYLILKPGILWSYNILDWNIVKQKNYYTFYTNYIYKQRRPDRIDDDVCFGILFF